MRERLSKQICRVVAIIQTLHRDGQLTLSQIHERLESGYCRRTIRRDLAALMALGCVRSTVVSRWDPAAFELTLGNAPQLPEALRTALTHQPENQGTPKHVSPQQKPTP